MVKISYIKDSKLDISLYQIYYYELKSLMMVENFHISHKIYLLINCLNNDAPDCATKTRVFNNSRLEYFIGLDRQ